MYPNLFKTISNDNKLKNSLTLTNTDDCSILCLLVRGLLRSGGDDTEESKESYKEQRE